MSLFVAEVAQRHAAEFPVMVMVQVGWCLAGAVAAPAKMQLVFLPPYSSG